MKIKCFTSYANRSLLQYEYFPLLYHVVFIRLLMLFLLRCLCNIIPLIYLYAFLFTLSTFLRWFHASVVLPLYINLSSASREAFLEAASPMS